MTYGQVTKTTRSIGETPHCAQCMRERRTIVSLRVADFHRFRRRRDSDDGGSVLDLEDGMSVTSTTIRHVAEQ
jgi:hypothetical protein